MGRIFDELSRRNAANKQTSDANKAMKDEKKEKLKEFRAKFNELLKNVVRPAFKEISEDFAKAERDISTNIDQNGFKLTPSLQPETFPALAIKLPRAIIVAVFPDDKELKVGLYLEFDALKLKEVRPFEVDALTKDDIIDAVMEVYDKITGGK